MKFNKNFMTDLILLKDQSQILINYLAWIANLGVVPLFLLAAFLLAPALFFLAALLFDVTLVLETMTKLLSQLAIKSLIYFRRYFLPTFGPSVKANVYVLGVILPLSLNFTYASEVNDLVLGIGEIKTIKLEPKEKYLISNKEVIQSKLNTAQNELLIKGKMQGMAEVMLIGTKAKKIYKFMVVNKLTDLKISALSMRFEHLGLNSKILGNKIAVEGEITNAKTYLDFYKLNDNESEIVKNFTINSEAMKSILGITYKKLLEENINYAKCNFENNELICTTPDYLEPSLDQRNLFSKYYGIKWIKASPNIIKNYQVKIKFVQFEQLDGKEIRLGLDALNSNLYELFHSPILKVVEKNSVLLNEEHLNISTLAEPIINTNLRTETVISLGSDIPYQTYDQQKNATNTSWHFSGLKIKMKLESVNDQIKLEYETELSKPNSDREAGSSGSKSKSSVVVKLRSPSTLFEISMRTTSQDSSEFPLLSKIPILGNLFKSKSNSDNYKKIYALVEVNSYE